MRSSAAFQEVRSTPSRLANRRLASGPVAELAQTEPNVKPDPANSVRRSARSLLIASPEVTVVTRVPARRARSPGAGPDGDRPDHHRGRGAGPPSVQDPGKYSRPGMPGRVVTVDLGQCTPLGARVLVDRLAAIDGDHNPSLQM